MQFGIFEWYAVKRKCVIKVFLNSQKWKLVCWGFFPHKVPLQKGIAFS